MNPLIKKALHDLRLAGKFDALHDIINYTENVMQNNYSYDAGISRDGEYIAWQVTHITIQRWRNVMNHASNSELQELVDYTRSILNEEMIDYVRLSGQN